MNLGIISDSHHFYDENNDLSNLSVLVDQFGCWADLFDSVTICAPLIEGPLPSTHKPYQHKNIELLPIPLAGGNSFRAKYDLLRKIPVWRRKLKELMRNVDAVHMRCPNNVSILGLLMLEKQDLYRQAVFTGSWVGNPGEPITYQFQRLFLKYIFKGPVAVYGEWDNQPAHIVPSFSPTYRFEDWLIETDQVDKRIERLYKSQRISGPIKILSVGALNENKNQITVLRSIRKLLDLGYECELDLVGDGVLREYLEEQTSVLQLSDSVNFHGRIPHLEVRKLYRQSDFVIQAPFSEGYGKVPIEAFFHGVVPILSNVDMSAQILGNGLRGRIFPSKDSSGIVEHVIGLSCNPTNMAEMIVEGRKYAKGITMESWQRHLSNMLNTYWGTNISLPDRQL